MKNKIRVSKSYINNGKIEGVEFEINIYAPLEDFIKNIIDDAEFLAKINGGNVYILKDKSSLYINYLDVMKTNKIDKLYKF